MPFSRNCRQKILKILKFRVCPDSPFLGPFFSGCFIKLRADTSSGFFWGEPSTPFRERFPAEMAIYISTQQKKGPKMSSPGRPLISWFHIFFDDSSVKTTCKIPRSIPEASHFLTSARAATISWRNGFGVQGGPNLFGRPCYPIGCWLLAGPAGPPGGNIRPTISQKHVKFQNISLTLSQKQVKFQNIRLAVSQKQVKF